MSTNQSSGKGFACDCIGLAAENLSGINHPLQFAQPMRAEMDTEQPEQKFPSCFMEKTTNVVSSQDSDYIASNDSRMVWASLTAGNGVLTEFGEGHSQGGAQRRVVFRQ